MRNIGIPIVAALLLIVWGCSSPTQFPTNGNHALKAESDFGVLTAQPDAYRGQAMKFAGRIVSVESTDQGTLVLAEWLPYPNREYDGPEDEGVVTGKQFTVMYPGKLDADGSLYGNKFLAVGQIESGKSMRGSGDATTELPQMNARCLHVWKTGTSALEWVDNEYDIEEETYCSQS